MSSFVGRSAPFDVEIAVLALAASALVLRVTVSGGVPASALRRYCLIVMRVRGEVEGHAFTARLDVNGNPVGEV